MTDRPDQSAPTRATAGPPPFRPPDRRDCRTHRRFGWPWFSGHAQRSRGHAMRDLMITLARRIVRQLRRDERGAIGVLVGLLIGGGVLTGMGALVVDVGELYQVRAAQQDGAD